MRRSKCFWLAGVCLLLVGLGANVNEAESSQRVAGLGGSRVTVNARQVSEGQLGFDFGSKSETNFGVGFLGPTFGDLPGSLTMSLNIALPSETNGTEGSMSITGGFWTLPISATASSGSLYGAIVQGDITPTQNPDKSQVSMVLTIAGGTLDHEGAVGRAVFAGTLTTDPRGGAGELEGTLIFDFD